MTELKPGDIVKFNIINRKYTQEGFSVGGGGLPRDELSVYQTINIESYPSCNDFKGSISVVKHGNYAIILKKIGRPWKVNQISECWSDYDVYEVYTAKFQRRHVFKYNLQKLF